MKQKTIKKTQPEAISEGEMLTEIRRHHEVRNFRVPPGFDTGFRECFIWAKNKVELSTPQSKDAKAFISDKLNSKEFTEFHILNGFKEIIEGWLNEYTSHKLSQFKKVVSDRIEYLDELVGKRDYDSYVGKVMQDEIDFLTKII